MAHPQSPGWYDDPENPQQLRYFDGVVWTRHTSPRSTRPAPGYAAGHGQYGSAPQDSAPQGSAPQAPAQGTGHGVGAPGAGPAPYGPGQGGAGPGWQPPQQWSPQQQAPQGGWHLPPAPTTYGAQARTPDGEALAGWWKRFAARLIDWVIVWLGSLPLTGYFIYRAGNELGPAFDRYVREIEQGNAGATPPTVTPDVLKWVVAYSVILTLVAIAYEVFFTTRTTAATPGKRALGLRIRLRERPGPLTFQTALTRTVIPMGGNLLSSLPLISTLVAMLQLADGLLPLVNQNKQAIHDLMARTNVVDTRKV
jgi:uncharacterized RDD family membrane protein YckC